jgi:uncharacterized protein with GYD domain
MKDFYLMMGRYDLMFIVDASDDTAVAKALLSAREASDRDVPGIH